MATTFKNRKKTQEYILKHIKMIDSIIEYDDGNKNKNYQYYKKIFNEMSDEQFNKYMLALRKKKSNLHIYLPNMKAKILNHDIINLAKKLKIVIFDYIKFKNPITNLFYTSNHKYLIMILPVRRLKQFLLEKIGLPESDKHISKLSGQVQKPDKGSKISLIELYMLMNRNLEKTAIEFIKVRGGDVKAYQEFKSKILNDKTVSLDSLDLKDSKPKSVKVIDAYFKGIHIDLGM